jgi:4'-phosphopantetheinyl transferase EntD
MNELSRLVAAIQPLLDPEILLDGGVVTDEFDPFNEIEWQQVADAGSKRQREFLCGRYYAHRLLESIGYTDVIISRDRQGCPQWPVNIVGSISHTSDFCIVLLSGPGKFRSVGVDLEESGRLKPSLWPRLFTQSELTGLHAVSDPVEQMRRAAIMFSAKEAFYKCDYAVNQKSYEFTDLEVQPDADTRRLVLRSAGKILAHSGCYATGMTHVMSVIYLAGHATDQRGS